MRVSAYSAAVNQYVCPFPLSFDSSAIVTVLRVSRGDRTLHAPHGDPVQPATAIQHFHDKLLHIRERMKTEPGKQMAEKRHKFVRLFSLTGLNIHGTDASSKMLDFLEAIDEEYDDKQ